MANEYWRKGVTKVYFTTAVITTAPTQAQITAGTNLSDRIASMDGWETAVARIDTDNLGSTFTSTITGPRTVGNAALTFLDVKNPAGLTAAAFDAVRTLLANGTRGTLMIMPYGTTTGNRVEIWPVESSGPNDMISLGNEPAKYTVEFGVTGLPNKLLDIAV